MTIYIDNNYKCHVTDDGTLTAIETDAFDGKCTEYIEGYRFVPDGEAWTREDGAEFAGEMVAPWKSWSELDNAQRKYEQEQIAQYETALTEIESALGVTS